MTQFMLLKMNHTHGSSTGPSMQGGVAVYFCAFFPPVMICQQCCPLPECKGAWNITVFPCVVQEADKLPPYMATVSLLPLLVQPCWPHPCAAAFVHFFCLSCLCFYVAFCLSLPAHCCLCILCFCFSSQPCWRHFFPLGNDVILLQWKPTPSPSSSLTHPESWEQETVIFLHSRTSWAIATQQGSKQAHIKGTQRRGAALQLQCPGRLLSSLPLRHVHLISSLPCQLFLLQAQQRNLLSTKLP